jgi:RNA polymerase sigma-70 factor, ECF subfamily
VAVAPGRLRLLCMLGAPLSPQREPEPMISLAEYRPQVQNLVARILRRGKDDADVQDCTHEALRRALERDNQPPGDVALLPWVLGIARHVALDALRAEYRRRARTVPSEPQRLDGASEDLVARLPHPDSDPESITATRQDFRRIGVALSDLPARQREVLLALHVEGLGYREIAERMGVPVGTVGTWVLRGRESLEAALSDMGRGGTDQKEH